MTRHRQTSAPDAHGTCAWCRKSFESIVDLIDHADRGHSLARRGPRIIEGI